ncbi:signal transduction histidine kinase [Paucimonas lemoignei]|uniref:histidine kinase n=2 Tax=Paucimonas lemoignei TaxID=29443 RepID=A0A4R3HTF8_PAULE|nr:signal transduction histidine kinase [Paucimonas lemoignei]
MEPILQGWEDFARSIQPSHRLMDTIELRDHAREILEEVAAELALPNQSRTRDAQGNTAAEIHADTRVESGFSIDQVVAEYRALRASVLNLWGRREKTATWFEVDDMSRFNDALDRALAESVARYSTTARQSQDIFLGVIGHDLRAPLHALSLGAQYLMRSEDADSKLIQLGSRMFNSTVRMQAILDNLLDFTRSRTGIGIPIRIEEVDLAVLSEQIAEEFRALNPGKIIKTHAEGNVSGWLDAGRIGQIYQNLIGNALQYGMAGTPVSILTREDGEEIILSVHNDGPPIPPEVKKNIFDPLRRFADGEKCTADRKNLGLGLYIVREIVLAHQGTINVSSTQDMGTTFTVRLPKSIKPTIAA